MYKADTSDFCYYPFFQVLMTADGRYRPCSKHAYNITNNGKVLKVGDATVEDAWNSDYMQQMRQNFKTDIRTEGCKECWREQDMGLKPMRYDSYYYNVPMSQVTNPLSPMRVEINASNICNLKCRICFSHASSKWIQEAIDIYGDADNKYVNREVHVNMTDENLAIIKKWIPEITEIGFFGGEPLLAEQNIDLMKYCVETGDAKHITILVNTNCTVYTQEIVELFKQFKHVFLNFSLDDIGKRFEYQRKGADFAKAVENIKQYLSHGGFTYENTIECKICCTVSNLNIFYFPEYFEFINSHFPGMPVYWNLLYDPWEYSMQILPGEIKEIIKERLKNYVSTTYEMTENRTKTIANLITYLEGEEEQGDFGGFFRMINRHDQYRQESFPMLFPEFWSLIAKYKPDDVEMYYPLPVLDG